MYLQVLFCSNLWLGLSQVNALLHSLDIDGNQTLKSPMRGSFPELEEYWTESQGALRSRMPNSANKWASEFAHQRESDHPETWVQSFEQQHGINGWASEFEQVIISIEHKILVKLSSRYFAAKE